MGKLEELLATTPPDRHLARQPAKELTPGYAEWNGQEGFATVQVAGSRIPTVWDNYLKDALGEDVDLDQVEIVGHTRVSGWDVLQGGKTVKMHSYKVNFRLRNPLINIDDIIREIKRKKPHVPKVKTETALVINTGDWQLGKIDGDGVAGATSRISESFYELARVARKKKPRQIHLALTGDHIEGFESQGGTNAWRTQLTLTEQLTLYTRLLFEGIKLLAPHCETMTIAAVGGNHGEAKRFGGKGITRYDDNWDVFGLTSVADRLKENPDAYGHVRVFVPAIDELTVSVFVAGTTVGHAHGHQFGSGKDAHWTWWKGQAFGGSHLSEATVLLSGHHHSFLAEEKGDKLFVRSPAQEAESVWWRHRTGDSGNPGLTYFDLADGVWSNLNTIHF